MPRFIHLSQARGNVWSPDPARNNVSESTSRQFPGDRRNRDRRPEEGLAEGLEQAARTLGWPEETRAFRPHLTLARARRGRHPEPPPALDPASESGWVRRLQLVRSHLGPAGASYTALDSFSLG